MRFLLVVLFILISGKAFAACTETSNVMTFPSGTSCTSEPDYYAVTIYEMGLCSAAPTAPTSSSAMVGSTCTVIYQNAGGQLVSVQNGVTGSLSNNELTTTPANGSYSHGYIRMSNDILVKVNQEFGSSLSGDDTSTSGVYCATKAVTYKNDGTSGTQTSVCNSTAPTAGTLTSKMVDFSGASAAGCFAVDASTCGGALSVKGGTLSAYLLDSSQYLATATGSVTALLGIQQFTTAVTIAETSTGMDVAFKVSEGMTVSDNGSGGVQFDSGPFSVILTIN